MLKSLLAMAFAALVFLPFEAIADPLCNELKRKKRQEFCKCHAEAGAEIHRNNEGQVRWRHWGPRGENARMRVLSVVQSCMERKGYKYEQE